MADEDPITTPPPAQPGDDPEPPQASSTLRQPFPTVEPQPTSERMRGPQRKREQRG